MKKALVVGGSSGVGLSIVNDLVNKGYSVTVADIIEPKLVLENVDYINANLFLEDDLKAFDEINDINVLIITAGFGRVARFEDLTDVEIKKLMEVDAVSIIRIIRKYYDKIKSYEDFYTAVLVSIAGHITSPLFAVYGAAKSALSAFIKSINAEMAAENYPNRVLDVSPGVIKGSSFTGTKTDLSQLSPLSNDILQHMFNKETLFIPQYDEVYKNVIAKDRADSLKFGVESYNYKKQSGRLVETKPQITIGYLSGTFDLFHVGHLNLLRKAKQQCDYLIVGVHESGSWKGKETFIPFEERLAIVQSIQYVDKAVMSFTEDSDAWDAFHYNKLFVGDDYKGTERFKKYEKYFEDKGVQIVYFPYTKGTSSTILRERLKK